MEKERLSTSNCNSLRDVAFKYIHKEEVFFSCEKKLWQFLRRFFWKILSSSIVGQLHSKRTCSQAFTETFYCSRPWTRWKLCRSTSWKRAFLVFIVFLLNFLNHSLGIPFRTGERHRRPTENSCSSFSFPHLTKMNTQNIQLFIHEKSKKTQLKNLKAKKHSPLGTCLFWQKIPSLNCNLLVSDKMLRSFERVFLSVSLFQNGNFHVKFLFGLNCHLKCTKH